MPKGYTDIPAIQTQLGRPLTTDESNAAVGLLDAAEWKVESIAGRTWPVAQITDEAYYGVRGPHLYLNTTPVQSVQTVKARAGIGATETTLVLNTDYEVRDLVVGHIYIPAQGGDIAGDILTVGADRYGTALPYDRLRVTYTPVATVPANVKLGTTLLVLHWLSGQISGLGPGQQSVSTAGDIAVTATKLVAEGGVPAEVLSLVRPRWGFA